MDNENKNKSVSQNVVTRYFKKYLDGAKNEMSETRILGKILSKAITDYKKDKKFTLSDEEKKFIKDQSTDILKILPLIVFQVLPGSSIATPFIVELSKKLGIKLNSKVPSNYKEKEKEGEKTKGEIDEFIGPDGTFSSSSYPILNQLLHPRKTMDQTIRMARTNQWPYVRKYYGESEEDDSEKVLDEDDKSEAFGYKETEDVSTFSQANKILKKMGIDDPIERYHRLKILGFDRNLDRQLKQEKRRGKCKGCFTKRKLTELEKNSMSKMIDEILLDKKNKSDEVVDTSEEIVISKILKRNIDSIKRIAQKEGISVNKLIQYFRKGE
jgi:hypothetical protein